MLTSPLGQVLDLILILSPSELHVPQALLCLKYHKHIFIEKPLANTLKEVDELERARVDSDGCVVFVGYMRRYAGPVRLVQERLEGKEIKYVRVRELIGSVSLFDSAGWCFFVPWFSFLLLVDWVGWMLGVYLTVIDNQSNDNFQSSP